MQYFAERHWRGCSLAEAVARGLRIQESTGLVFTWLTSTNAGAADVCRAALGISGIHDDDLAHGHLPDPASKSALRILARPGIVIRLTRNFDKIRGFVNGAVGTVCESLRGNAVFIVKLHGTGNLVLVYPMEEDGSIFLPCCYGYATTIRRAQGASLDQGCIWFNQKRHHAGIIQK